MKCFYDIFKKRGMFLQKNVGKSKIFTYRLVTVNDEWLKFLRLFLNKQANHFDCKTLALAEVAT